jgi:hypothetical protein
LVAPDGADPPGVARMPPSGDLARLDPTEPISPQSARALLSEPPLSANGVARNAAVDLLVDLRAHPDQPPQSLATFYVVFGRGTKSDWDSPFWDVYHATLESVVSVLSREIDGTTSIVARASVATNIRSVEKTRAALLWKASAMLAQAIRQYGTRTAAERKSSALARFGPPQDASLSGAPGPVARAMLRARVLGRRLLMPGSLMRDQWRIAIANASIR